MRSWVCGALLALLLLQAPPAGARRPLCPAPPARCVAGGGGQNEYNYKVDDETLLIEYADGSDFVLTCSGNVTLDSASLPRFNFSRPVLVPHIKLRHCPPPVDSYADSLLKLGLEAGINFTLVGPLALRRSHLAGLGRVTKLSLEDVALADDALAALPALSALRLEGRAPPAALPPTLRAVHLVRAGTPARGLLAAAAALRTLLVRHDRPVALSAAPAPALEELTVDSPATDVGAELPASLATLVLYDWAPAGARPVAWAACAALNRLTVIGGEVRALPAGWVSRCRALEVLDVSYLNLGDLPEAVLTDATALRKLTLVDCNVTSLPERFLEHAKNLEELDLSNNNLRALPSAMFVGPSRLYKLWLSHNKLEKEALSGISGDTLVKHLTELYLDSNPLGDTCSGGIAVRGVSPLQALAGLRHLALGSTGASQMCRDWYKLELHTLDLRDNHFAELEYGDLTSFGATPVDVQLGGNNVTRLKYRRCDYYAVRDGATTKAKFQLDPDMHLRCDCNIYWAARALREVPAHVTLQGAVCGGSGGGGPGGGAHGIAPGAVPSELLRCAVPAAEWPAGLPPACRVARQPRARGRSQEGCAIDSKPDTSVPSATWFVDCAAAGLESVPPLARDHPTVAWNLTLPNNSISSLSPDDLPTNLVALDLRFNEISSLDDATLRAAGGSGRLRLEGNALDCGCGATASLAALGAHNASLDYARLACAPPHSSPGAALLAAPARCAPRAWPLAAAGAALLALLAAGGGALALHARTRARLKRLLRRAGWLAPAAEGAARRWDAFVSYSHHDAAAARALVARLEGALRYRVCEHGRDWAPGGLIPAQIAASVRRSRVTLALLSEHFVRSQWACAEFRAALRESAASGSARLVAVLLREPAELPLDDGLRRYLAANTYLLWGEPLFWDKLCRTLGPPRHSGPDAGPAPEPAPEPGAEPAPLERSERKTASTGSETDSAVSASSLPSTATSRSRSASDSGVSETIVSMSGSDSDLRGVAATAR